MDIDQVLLHRIISAVVPQAKVRMVPPLVKLGAQTHHAPESVSTSDAILQLAHGFTLELGGFDVDHQLEGRHQAHGNLNVLLMLGPGERNNMADMGITGTSHHAVVAIELHALLSEPLRPTSVPLLVDDELFWDSSGSSLF